MQQRPSIALVTGLGAAHHGWSGYDSKSVLRLTGTIRESGYEHPTATSGWRFRRRPGWWCWPRRRAWKTEAFRGRRSSLGRPRRWSATRIGRKPTRCGRRTSRSRVKTVELR
ncbi:MAG: hypothetical protein MZV49_06845 [Rhodopseudomonas palustris]|nr:hypothetical protein [Rhodopseudomonas palustris]